MVRYVLNQIDVKYLSRLKIWLTKKILQQLILRDAINQFSSISLIVVTIMIFFG